MPMPPTASVLREPTVGADGNYHRTGQKPHKSRRTPATSPMANDGSIPPAQSPPVVAIDNSLTFRLAGDRGIITVATIPR